MKTKAFKEYRHTARVCKHAVKRAKTRKPYSQPTGQLARKPAGNVVGGFMELLRREIYAKGRAA